MLPRQHRKAGSQVGESKRELTPSRMASLFGRAAWVQSLVTLIFVNCVHHVTADLAPSGSLPCSDSIVPGNMYVDCIRRQLSSVLGRDWTDVFATTGFAALEFNLNSKIIKQAERERIYHLCLPCYKIGLDLHADFDDGFKARDTTLSLNFAKQKRWLCIIEHKAPNTTYYNVTLTLSLKSGVSVNGRYLKEGNSTWTRDDLRIESQETAGGSKKLQVNVRGNFRYSISCHDEAVAGVEKASGRKTNPAKPTIQVPAATPQPPNTMGTSSSPSKKPPDQSTTTNREMSSPDEYIVTPTRTVYRYYQSETTALIVGVVMGTIILALSVALIVLILKQRGVCLKCPPWRGSARAPSQPRREPSMYAYISDTSNSSQPSPSNEGTNGRVTFVNNTETGPSQVVVTPTPTVLAAKAEPYSSFSEESEDTPKGRTGHLYQGMDSVEGQYSHFDDQQTSAPANIYDR